MTLRFAALSSLVLGLASAVSLAQDAKKDAKPADGAKKLSFHRDIRPILRVHCQGCHQPAKPGGNLVLTSYADMKKGGQSGDAAFIAGKPEASPLLLQVISEGGQKPAMPKDRPPLDEADVAKIRQWIVEGAVDDTPPAERVTVDMDHPPTYVLPPVITSLDFSPDGKLLAVSGYHEVLLHKADGSGIEARLVGLSERIESAVFSPDGKLLAVTGGSPGRFGEVQIWDVAAKKLKLSVNVGFDTLYGASWSPNGKMVAFGCPDNTVRAIDPETGKQVLQQGAHNDWVLGTTFSSDGKFLVSCSRDRALKLTEVATQRFIDNITSITPGVLKGGLTSVRLRPQKEKKTVKVTNIAVASTEEKIYEELLIGGADGQPKLYKMHRESKRVIGDDANKVREFEPMPGRIYDLDFSPDGNLFVAASSSDGKGEVRVYQTNDGKRVSTLQGERGGVFAVAFRRDGKEIASAGFDGLVRLNDPATGKLIKEFVAVPLSTKVSGK